MSLIPYQYCRLIIIYSFYLVVLYIMQPKTYRLLTVPDSKMDHLSPQIDWFHSNLHIRGTFFKISYHLFCNGFEMLKIYRYENPSKRLLQVVRRRKVTTEALLLNISCYSIKLHSRSSQNTVLTFFRANEEHHLPRIPSNGNQKYNSIR